MADDQNITSSDQTHDQPGPNPALKSLDIMVGTCAEYVGWGT
jgi:hypothetical protein